MRSRAKQLNVRLHCKGVFVLRNSVLLNFASYHFSYNGKSIDMTIFPVPFSLVLSWRIKVHLIRITAHWSYLASINVSKQSDCQFGILILSRASKSQRETPYEMTKLPDFVKLSDFFIYRPQFVHKLHTYSIEKQKNCHLYSDGRHNRRRLSPCNDLRAKSIDIPSVWHSMHSNTMQEFTARSAARVLSLSLPLALWHSRLITLSAGFGAHNSWPAISWFLFLSHSLFCFLICAVVNWIPQLCEIHAHTSSAR